MPIGTFDFPNYTILLQRVLQKQQGQNNVGIIKLSDVAYIKNFLLSHFTDLIFVCFSKINERYFTRFRSLKT